MYDDDLFDDIDVPELPLPGSRRPPRTDITDTRMSLESWADKEYRRVNRQKIRERKGRDELQRYREEERWR